MLRTSKGSFLIEVNRLIPALIITTINEAVKEIMITLGISGFNFSSNHFLDL